MTRTGLHALLLTVALSAPGFAQTSGPPPALEVFGGFSANGYSPGDEMVQAVAKGSSLFTDQAGGPNGFEGSVARYVTQNVAFKASVIGFWNHSQGSSILLCQDALCVENQGFGVRSRTVYALAGPEVHFATQARFAPMAHALLGVVRSTSRFSTSGTDIAFSDQTTDTGVAAMFGGGLDIRFAPRFSVRTTMDYLPTWLNEGATGERERQEHIRLTAGVVWRWR